MYTKYIKAGTLDLSVAGYPKSDQFAEPLVVISTNSGGLYGSLHLTPDEARALGKCLVEAAENADTPAVQVAA